MEILIAVIIWIAFLSSFIGKWENDKREIREHRERERRLNEGKCLQLSAGFLVEMNQTLLYNAPNLE